MAIRLSTRWLSGDEELDRCLIPLLRAVADHGSLNRAVSSLRLSYRHAWGLLGKIERTLGQPVVILERGRGARLSPFGEKLLAADDAAVAALGRELRDTIQSLNREPAARQRRAKPLVIHASHDLALAELRNLLSRQEGIAVDLHFRGSLECLADLAHAQCDIAGFHVPDVAPGSSAYRPYLPWLRARSLRLIRFVTRRQGLMVARGNPKGLRTLGALAESDARFINRQPSSGTRICFDHLLAAARIRPAQIHGYQVEEFTHAAVAATIASGMADAGLGIEAAARQHGLDFVPLATERYFLAARSTTVTGAAAQALLESMKSSAFRSYLAGLPGYEPERIGEVISAREALRAI
jgi:putative molybdopterin biosynthesis protein